MATTPVTSLKVGDVLDLATAPPGSQVTVPPPKVAVVTGINPPVDDPPDAPTVGFSLAGGACLWMPREGRITVLDSHLPIPAYWRQTALAELSRRPAPDPAPNYADYPNLVRLFLIELAGLLDESPDRDWPVQRDALVRVALLAICAVGEIDEAIMTAEYMPLGGHKR
jgi:hypothetical protein